MDEWLTLREGGSVLARRWLNLSVSMALSERIIHFGCIFLSQSHFGNRFMSKTTLVELFCRLITTEFYLKNGQTLNSSGFGRFYYGGLITSSDR